MVPPNVALESRARTNNVLLTVTAAVTHCTDVAQHHSPMYDLREDLIVETTNQCLLDTEEWRGLVRTSEGEFIKEQQKSIGERSLG